MTDYQDRNYLSTIEVATHLGVKVKKVIELIRYGLLPATKSAGGQYRVSLDNVKVLEHDIKYKIVKNDNDILNSFKLSIEKGNGLSIKELHYNINNTVQKVFLANSQSMNQLENNSVHLVITSPPYFDAKMYSNEAIVNDLGNIHDMDDWFNEIGKVWKEVFRVLQPGRKFFLNIMNLPIRIDNSFKSLNLVGKSIDLCDDIGFVFKRDIIWHKTNGVRAHFGTYPYPGGILINNMHEFILEFQKPDIKYNSKYKHLTKEIKENSKIDKDFWLSIKNTDVWLIKPENSGDGRSHIAPFPYDLPYKLIKAYSYKTETVLDPFCGSGTTLFAAKDIERNGIGYEINPDFVMGIKNRFESELKCIYSEEKT